MFHIARLSILCILFANPLDAGILQKPLQNGHGTLSPKNSAALDRLHDVVGDRLIHAIPVGRPCFTNGLSSSDQCGTVSTSKVSDQWTAHQPGGYFYNNWASCQATGETCALPMQNVAVPGEAVCHQGSVPPLMINLTDPATLVDDILAAFEYANETKTPLVIKNTGHDWKGRSSSPDALALWTHHLNHTLQPIQISRNFTPLNCSNHPKETVFHYGAGQQWEGAYDFAHKNGLAVVGGTCGTVGVAGWIHGGGHSPLTPMYGMGADNLRQIEIVTPQEGKIIASECHNPDVFFAVRGGGGGTFGVVTNITYKAIDPAPVQDFRFTIKDLNDSDTRQYFDILASHSVEWSKTGWGGYMKSSTNAQTFEMVNTKLTLDKAKNSMENITSFLETRGCKYTFKTQEQYWNFFDEVMRPPTEHIAGWSMNVGSRLLSKDVFEGKKKKQLTDGLMAMYRGNLSAWFMFVAPTMFPHTKTSALHPTWKDAVISLRVSDKWDQYDDTTKSIPARTHFDRVHQGLKSIIELTPRMGVSISEADIWEENHTEQFWGDANYKKLLKVKDRLDPHNILSSYSAVGWSPNDARYSCYPKL